MSVKGINIHKRFKADEVLKGVSFSFPSKGMIGLIGVSGAGKSTLLRIIGGLDNEYKGYLEVDNRKLITLSEEERRLYRLNKVSFLYQGSDLFDDDSVLTNILLPLEVTSSHSLKVMKRKAYELLDMVGLKSKAKKRVKDLSGGERQRVALARALINESEILLCDEPTGALDDKNARKILEILKTISKKCLVIIVSHDVNLISNYVDELYSLKDGELFKEEVKEQVEAKKLQLPIRQRKRKDKQKLPLSFIFKHAFNSLFAHKRRSLLFLFIISFSFTSLFTATYLKNGLSSRLSHSFEAVSGAPSIVLKRKNASGSTISSVYAISIEEARELASSRSDLFKDYGVSYYCDFENYFPDSNMAYFPIRGKKHVIPGLSLRSANDYLYLDDVYSCEPEKPTSLEDDQIVLGLDQSSLVNLCYALQIHRSYEALGNYLESNTLELIFEAANESWNYGDQQIVSVVAVTRSSVPTIYHYSREWSTYLFEFKMRFPTSRGEDNSLPWIMMKMPYVTPRRDNEFFNDVKKDISLSNLIFEGASYEYEKTHCPIGKKCDLNRYYPFYSDAKSLSYKLIKNLEERQDIKGFYTLTDGSYAAYPSAFMMGFASPMYITGDEDKLLEVIDSVGQIKTEVNTLEVSLPEGVEMGYYLKPASSSVGFTNSYGDFISGGPPISLDEIAISDILFNKLGQPNYLYLTTYISEQEVGDYLIRDFRTATLKISGVYKSNFASVGHHSRWCEEFYSRVLGQSSFVLEPAGAILEIDPERGESIIKELSLEYPELEISSPYQSIEDSLSYVSNLLSQILLAFSSLALVFAFILLVTSTLLSSKEAKKEKELFHKLGIKSHEVIITRSLKTFLLSFLSLVISIFLSLGLQILIGLVLDKAFGATSIFSLDLSFLIPSLVLLIVMAILSVFSECLYFSRASRC